MTRRLLFVAAIVFVVALPAGASAAPAAPPCGPAAGPACGGGAAKPAPTTSTTAPIINGQPAPRVTGNPCGPAAGPQCGQPPDTSGASTIGGLAGGAVDAAGSAAAGAAGAAVNPIVGAVSNTIFDDIAKGMIGWATGMLKDVTKYVQTGKSQPDLGAKPFDALYAKMEVLGGLAAVIAFVVFLSRLHGARANLTALARLAVGAAVMPNIPRLVDLGYQGINAATSAVSSGLGGDMTTITTAMQKATAGLGTLSSGLGFLIAVLAFIGAGLILFDLILLSVLVPIIIVFAPILIGLAVHEGMIPLLKKVGVLLAGAMTGGFVMAVFATVGAAILTGTTSNDITSLVEGAIILGLTAIAPFTLAALVGVQTGWRRNPAGTVVRGAIIAKAVL